MPGGNDGFFELQALSRIWKLWWKARRAIVDLTGEKTCCTGIFNTAKDQILWEIISSTNLRKRPEIQNERECRFFQFLNRCFEQMRVCWDSLKQVCLLRRLSLPHLTLSIFYRSQKISWFNIASPVQLPLSWLFRMLNLLLRQPPDLGKFSLEVQGSLINRQQFLIRNAFPSCGFCPCWGFSPSKIDYESICSSNKGLYYASVLHIVFFLPLNSHFISDCRLSLSCPSPLTFGCVDS